MNQAPSMLAAGYQIRYAQYTPSDAAHTVTTSIGSQSALPDFPQNQAAAPTPHFTVLPVLIGLVSAALIAAQYRLVSRLSLHLLGEA